MRNYCRFLARSCHGRNVRTTRRALTNSSSSSSSSSSSMSSIQNKYTNTLIIGGGPIGSSTAYHLACQRGGDGRGIVVVEKDPTYQKASATRSAGGIRQQYSLKENVQMSLYGRDFLRTASETLQVDVQFQEHGYLFLATTAAGRDQMIANHQVQCDAGCTDIQLLSPSELQQKFPWMYTDDILLASYGTKGEGWFDPWSLISGFKTKCLEMGVQYLHGGPVNAHRDALSGSISAVDLQLMTQSASDADASASGATIQRHSVDYVVNAAGAYSELVMQILAGFDTQLQYPIPVKPRKRSVFFFHCNARPQELIPSIAPLTIDPTSLVYFRSEGAGANTGNFLCGVSPLKPEDDLDAYEHNHHHHHHVDDGHHHHHHTTTTTNDIWSADHHLFEDIIWPALYHRVPAAFGEIKVKASWAGLYEYNTLDQNAIIDFHPELPNVLMLNGFSGHGLQMSPAAGRAGAELLDHGGNFQTLDLNIFRFDRCQGLKQPVFESGIV